MPSKGTPSAEELEGESTMLPMGKYFASSDKAVRDKAVEGLKQFLVARGDDLLDDKELTKLWKGLFFCFWHSDKPLVQQALATDLAELLLKIPSAPASLHFLKGFWDMILREWTKIDVHRIDKFYMLIRRFVNAAFRLQLRENWDDDCCEAYEYILTRPNGPLDPDDPKHITSLAYHLADVYLEELEKALDSSESTCPVPILDVIHPFLAFAARTPVKASVPRLQDAIFQPLTSALAQAASEEPPTKRARLATGTPSPAFSTTIARSTLDHSRHYKSKASTSTTALDSAPSEPQEIRKAILKAILDIGGQPETREHNRKKLFAFWKAATAEGQSDQTEWDAS
ncbi:hypothetical protein FRC04_003588 [Tulasnella sp. 424]|nr:hypothetical protein FRC04_003588 [Tulasnella sp. 424]KAG8965339.1 hypothetical protein FRC05_003284 [Tulasnella sp. 425]